MARKKDTNTTVISITAARMQQQDRIHYANVIRNGRARKKMDQETLAAICGIPTHSISNWERGLSLPPIRMIPVLCEVLELSPAEFFDAPFPTQLPAEEEHLLSTYRNLDEANRHLASRFLDEMVASQYRRRSLEIRRMYRSIPDANLFASAGPGAQERDKNIYGSRVFVRRNGILDRADFLITVNGASMEPDYPDGAKVYVEKTADARPGGIYVFQIDNALYIKEYQPDGLHSINPDYPVMPAKEIASAQILGKVLGVVEQSDYPTEEELDILRSAPEED